MLLKNVGSKIQTDLPNTVIIFLSYYVFESSQPLFIVLFTLCEPGMYSKWWDKLQILKVFYW